MIHRALIPVILLTSISTAASAQELLFVARDGGGRLVLDLPAPPEFDVLPSGDPSFPGWVTDDPSFITVPADRPGEDRFTLGPGSDLLLQFISADPRLRILNPVTFEPLPPDSTYRLGPAPFDAVLLWNVPEWTDQPLQVSFRLLDTGSTHYLPSPDYTVVFIAIPGPGCVTVLAIALTGRSRRRRRVPSTC